MIVLSAQPCDCNEDSYLHIMKRQRVSEEIGYSFLDDGTFR